MKGIIVDDLELIIKKSEGNINVLLKDEEKIFSEINELRKFENNSCMNLLIKNLNMQAKELKKMEIKLNSYTKSLHNVVNGYKNQSEEIIKSLKKQTP